MKIILRNTLAILLGFVAGSILNMTLVLTGPHVIPPPAGVDVSKTESIRAHVHLFEARHFVFPLLAHAGGAFAGALVAFLVAGSRRSVFAFTIGVLFLAGGITACFMIPAPPWFVVLDLGVAYLPMAWLATRLGRRLTGATTPAQSPGQPSAA